jgi:glycosyltransferase involved in cell wall biosynthesis
MLAVRGALGEIPEMRSSSIGRLLQLWIRRGLRCATQVACVSQFTLHDAARILKSGANLTKVLNGLNYPFHPIGQVEADRRLAGIAGLRSPFILHVGSNHPRKNRDGVMRIFAQVAKPSGLQLVFAGEKLNRDLQHLASELQIENRIVEVVKPQVEVIEALYSQAVALIFPSRYEGFGWPVIEAQACGCPVVASDIPPLAEILGDSAPLHHMEDDAAMAESVLRLAADNAFHAEKREQGLENVRSRFQTSRMMEDYLSLYRKLAAAH